MIQRRWRMLAVIGALTVVALGGWVWNANQVKPIATKQVDLGNGVTMDFVWIPPGEFMMGSPTNEVGRSDDETQYRVKISKGFWMGKYEVTQEQYAAVMGTNTSPPVVGNRYPVNNVSWDDAVAFCTKVKERTGSELRLPTEAEWEYSCRAGTTTVYYTGDTEADLARAGCFAGNVERGIKLWKLGRRRIGPWEVGSFEPNGWGLYDMHGNMLEWCSDYDMLVGYPGGTEQEVGRMYASRGGYWYALADECRSAFSGRSVSSGVDVYGFRCVLVR